MPVRINLQKALSREEKSRYNHLKTEWGASSETAQVRR